MCVMSLLLRYGALTWSHHKQQSHHQSKEQVHLHFAVESFVLWQVPHSVSLCQCEVGDLSRGLCAGSASIFGNVVHLGVESESVVCWRCAYEPTVFWESIFMVRERALWATCGSVLAELWVWSEVICLLVEGSRGQSMGNPPNLHVHPC